MGHNSQRGGLGLTAEAHARSEGQLARKKNLESGARRISTFNGTFGRGDAPGIGADRWPQGWVAPGLAPFNFRVARHPAAIRTGTSTTWLHRWAMYSRMSSGSSWSVERWKYCAN